MSNVTNTSQVSNYQYNITTGMSTSGVSNISSVTLDVKEASIIFTKSNDVNYMDLGGTTTITYTITNGGTENISLATITDPIFTIANVTHTNLQGATLLGNVLTVELPTGGLAKNGTAKVNVQITVSKEATPSSSIYDTSATGAFTVATLPVSVVSKTTKGHLEVNSAILVVSKSVIPNVSSITAGNLLTYTITITNTGNVAATIPIGKFVDSWSINGLTGVQVGTSGFKVSGNEIKNTEVITVNPGAIFTLIVTGTASVPAISS